MISYADDTSLSIKEHCTDQASEIISSLDYWFASKNIILYIGKTQLLSLDRGHRKDISVIYQNSSILAKSQCLLLGVMLDCRLAKYIYALKFISESLGESLAMLIYK